MRNQLFAGRAGRRQVVGALTIRDRPLAAFGPSSGLSPLAAPTRPLRLRFGRGVSRIHPPHTSSPTTKAASSAGTTFNTSPRGRSSRAGCGHQLASFPSVAARPGRGPDSGWARCAEAGGCRRRRGSRRPEHRTWTAEELGRFLDHVAGDPRYPALLLAATTGLRRGELLGLRWADLDLGRGRAAIRQTLLAVRDVDATVGTHRPLFGTPKTDRERTVPLPARTVAALRAHRKRQLAERLAVGPDYTDHGLVFCEPDGSPIHPVRFAKRFRVRVARAGVPAIRFHDLRHTWATLALRPAPTPRSSRRSSATPRSRSPRGCRPVPVDHAAGVRLDHCRHGQILGAAVGSIQGVTRRSET